ncbi:MAG: hypothetical protein ACLFPV_15805, partial [Spirochaetaceae bacterium]
MKIPRIVPIRLAQAGLVLSLVLILAGCFAPLGRSSEGSLAINASLPGSIFTQATESYVARVYVANLDYEDLVRRFLAYQDFLDENPSPGSAWESFYNELEEEKEDIDIDLALKAVMSFGGNPYVDIAITQSGALAEGDDGSFTIAGLPAGRSYTVYIDVYNAGDEDDEDEDNVAESRLFTDGNPYDDMFVDSDDGIVGENTLAAAQTAFNNVFDDYTDTTAHPVVSTFVEEGETATI